MLSFRWNSFQTAQVYLSCADIAIVGNNSGGGETKPSTTKTTATATTLITSSKTASATASCTPATTVAVTFNHLASTSYGESIKLVGSLSQLGSWTASSGVALSASQYTTSNPLWTATVKIPAGTKFEYKFVKVSSNDGSAVTWESDPNRSYTVPESCAESVTVESSWK